MIFNQLKTKSQFNTNLHVWLTEVFLPVCFHNFLPKIGNFVIVCILSNFVEGLFPLRVKHTVGILLSANMLSQFEHYIQIPIQIAPVAGGCEVCHTKHTPTYFLVLSFFSLSLLFFFFCLILFRWPNESQKYLLIFCL